VALEATFRELSASLSRLGTVLDDLQVNLGDTPPGASSSLADRVETGVTDLVEKSHLAARAALLAQKALDQPAEMDRVRRGLATCQQRLEESIAKLDTEQLAPENLRDLARLAKERPEWQPWAQAARQGMEQCRSHLEGTSRALLACWPELAERLGKMNISVRATNVGQQITVPRGVERDLETEGVT
jgi:hypothetical protein